MGAEAFDAEGKIHLRKLVKSKIFKVFTLPYIQAAIALPLTYFVLTALPGAGSVQATVDVILITLGVHLSTFLGLYLFMRKSIHTAHRLEKHRQIRFASATYGNRAFLLSSHINPALYSCQSHRRLCHLHSSCCSIDHQARELLDLLIEEIKGTLRQLTSKNNGFKDENGDLPSEN